MCNRYRVAKDRAAIEHEMVGLDPPVLFPPDLAPPNRGVTGDIRPTDPAYVVGASGEVAILPWGFPGPRGPVINFRSEGRRFARESRCLVVADGFYETTAPADPKQKRRDWWLFETASGEPFALAGLIRDGRFTLLTCAPGPDVAPIHDRQVAVLTGDQRRAWLSDPGQEVLSPSPAGLLRVSPVTPG